MRDNIIVISCIILFLAIGGVIGHFAFPIVKTVEVLKQSKNIISNHGLSVNMTPSEGTVIITGFGGNIWWGRIENTDSMFPTMKDGEVLLESVSMTDIRIRDIIVFYSPFGELPTAHRVVAIGEDNQGWYADTLADNKDVPNGKTPYRVRYSQIIGKVRVYFDY